MPQDLKECTQCGHTYDTQKHEFCPKCEDHSQCYLHEETRIKPNNKEYEMTL